MPANPVGLEGIGFLEFASPDPDSLHRLFLSLGFSRVARHPGSEVELYRQNGIRFFLNRRSRSLAGHFCQSHGPSLPSMGWMVRDPEAALDAAVARGASPCTEGDFHTARGPVPAVYGIGGSVIYFLERDAAAGEYAQMGFRPLDRPDVREPMGFSAIDHLTNNVEPGGMDRWSRFYEDIFGFTEVRYFNIRGESTGLLSHALRSPCGTFCIPINEGTEHASQINEYLRRYRGPGIQHLAFLTEDILASLSRLEGSGIGTLDIDDGYYDSVFDRVPGVTENREEIRRRKVLVDGDENGYLLQIFTRNLIGPIFIEIIQRKNHLSFGEGNFGALFRSMEREQQSRGAL